MGVFVTSYEVNATGLPIIEQHISAAQAWRDSAWAITEEFGGDGFKPSRCAGIQAVMFKGAAPTGWRQTGREPGKPDYVLAVPRKTSKAGKAAADRLESLGPLPGGEDAAKLFGWNPGTLAMDTSRGVIYFPTFQTIELPSPRHFLRLPRFPEDKWPGHDGLTEVPESEYMRAIEAHNAIVRERKVAKAEVA